MINVDGNNFVTIARDNNIPFYATIELTYSCNLKCIHCYLAEDISDEMSTKEVKDTINQLVKQGTMDLTFTGGEALLRDDFFEIAEYAKEKHLALNLITNGTLIDQITAKRLAELRFQNISISIYGLNCHDEVTQVVGSLEKSLNAVRLLRENNVSVDIKTPVMNINIKDIEALEKMCRKWGAEFSPNPYITIKTDGSRKPLDYRLNDDELYEYLKLRWAQGERIAGFNDMCNTGRCMVCISAKGDVFPCIALKESVGNIREKSFCDIWNNSLYLKSLRDINLDDFIECNKCSLRSYCYLCPGETMQEDNNIYGPNLEACRIAKIRKRVEKESKKNENS